MGFLYPVFLAAGITLAIPLFIHLFNLRRYKTVFFPHTRFLRAIQLRSRRSSEVRYKWLLSLRMLFLAALIASFAQPLFNRNKKNAGTRNLQVIYIDNNPAMGLKKGARSLLDIALESVRQQIRAAGTGSRFLLLTNDRSFSYEPQDADKLLNALNGIGLAPGGKSSSSVFATLQSLMQTENSPEADLYYYSNFSRSSFPAHPEASLLHGINFHGIAVQAKNPGNSFIDTAYLTTPVLQTGQNNSLIVRTRNVAGGTNDAGNQEGLSPVLQLSINGQVKSAASLKFDAAGTSIDTMSFSVSESGWQRIILNIADKSMPFDDTFRIAARSAPGLSVLVLDEGSPSPYIQAAFRSYNGFNVRSFRLDAAPDNWKDYNLIILNGLTGMSERVGKMLQTALNSGQSVCVFPSKTRNLPALNAALGFGGEIRITSFDSAVQTVSNLQAGADLVRDIFEGIPPNIQLPVVNWHYAVQSGLSASGQSILTFRNGDPLLARYSSGKGSLYLCTSSAELDGGNFPASYFFVPFLYQMAAQSKGSDVYALSAGFQQSAFLPIHNSNERNMVHLYAPGLDAIPPQRSSGGGVDVFVDAVIQQPGFYRLAAASGDSVIIGLNGTRNYSMLDFWDIDHLHKEWPDPNGTWQTPEMASASHSNTGTTELPLWKVCAILALILTIAETLVLIRRRDTSVPVATN